MAKQNNSGPVRYHNLAGWLRDLRKALDNGDQEGYEVAEILIECDELIGDGYSEDAEDGLGSSTDGDSPQMEIPECADSVQVRGAAGRPAPRSRPGGAAASVLDRALDGLAGPERDQAIAELDSLRMHSLGTSGVNKKCKPPEEVMRGKKRTQKA